MLAMRSMLFVPGDRPERFAKAEASGADAVVLDLEDAVAPSQRPMARSAIASHLAKDGRPVPVWVRINAIGGSPGSARDADAEDGAALADLLAVLPARPDGLLLPKARHGEDLARLDHWLEALEARYGLALGSTRVIPMITETAGAMLAMPSFAAHPRRVCAFTWGAEDLASDLGAAGNRNPAGDYELPYALAGALCQYAASAAGLPAIDTVDTEIRDVDGVARRAAASRRAGFIGKLAIHPAQIAPLNAAFTPGPDEIEHAERVLAAFAAAPAAGALRLEGKLIDRPHRLQAQRVLAAAGRRP